jgi:aldehyde:ferredoxin oxidoreductase
MDRNDMATALDLFYAELGWDRRTGAPAYDAYRRLGLEPVARELKKRDLTP